MRLARSRPFSQPVYATERLRPTWVQPWASNPLADTKGLRRGWFIDLPVAPSTFTGDLKGLTKKASKAALKAEEAAVAGARAGLTSDNDLTATAVSLMRLMRVEEAVRSSSHSPITAADATLR